VFAGMLGVTLFGLLFTPVFYVLVRRVGQLLDALTRPGPPRKDAPGSRTPP